MASSPVSVIRIKKAIEQERSSSPHDAYGWYMRPSQRQRVLLCQRMHDHRSGDRRGWPDEQSREVLFDPREPATVRLLRSRMAVEDADRRHRVVRRIDHIIGHQTLDITDYRNGALLDPACQLFG